MPWRRKVIEYVKKIRPVALYGSASWQWGADTSTALTTWEAGMLRRMCRVGWRKADGEEFGKWRRRHTRVARQQMEDAGAEDIISAMLRRQCRWITANLRRFSADLLGQTRRRQQPQAQCWHRILASIRDGSLPEACRAQSGTACAVTIFLTINDEEGWRLQQGIMTQLDPKNTTGWRHSKPGRIGRWEGVMLRCLGPRWKEAILTNDRETITDDMYVETGRSMVGRAGGPVRLAERPTTTDEEVLDENKARKRPRRAQDSAQDLDSVSFEPAGTGEAKGRARLVVATDFANMAPQIPCAGRACLAMHS